MNKKLTVADLKTVFGGDPQSPDTGTPAPPPKKVICICWSIVHAEVAV